MTKPTPPKGKVKGGARFPRHDLRACHAWAQKLVNKTHTGPQPQDVILAGVVETKGPNGEVKISAMKQFGLIDGDKNAYIASDLAKKMINSPENERLEFFQASVLLPTLFRPVFDTFQGDETPLSKIRHRLIDLNVHPENSDACVGVYTKSLEFAGLGTISGESFTHIPSTNLATDPIQFDDEMGDHTPAQVDHEEKIVEPEYQNSISTKKGSASVQVNVTIDSSLDVEKLERQLMLLKKYGAL